MRKNSSVAPALRFKATGILLVASVLGCLAVVPGAARQQPVRGLSAATELARVYDAIFDARFNDVPSLLAKTCPPAPLESCRVLDAVAAWWRIQIDPFDTTRDAAFQSLVDEAIAEADAWTAREPRRAEAWFYLGGAYGARVQWRVLRGERLSAARDGKRIKQALERALMLDPTMADAYFGVGLYRYYADVAPSVLKMLRWMLLLPGGDRMAGLAEMLRARHDGQLVRSEADYQLHLVYLWYEKQPKRALEILAELEAKYPRNPHFQQAAAEIEDIYLHDATASLEIWQRLLRAALNRRIAEPEMSEAAARLGIAEQLQRLSKPDAAVEHLRAVIAARPAAPYGAVSRAYLQLGQALDRTGRRSDAASAYRAAIAEAGRHDPLKVAAHARTALRTTGR